MGESTRYQKCRNEISSHVRQKIDLSREVEDAEIQEMIDSLIVQMGRTYALSLKERQELGKSVFCSIRKMDVLQELIDCDEVTEIMVNGTESIFVEKAGSIFQWDKRFETQEKLEDVIQQIVAKCNRVVNEASPIADARLENGARVNIVLAPVALNGTSLRFAGFPSIRLRWKICCAMDPFRSRRQMNWRVLWLPDITFLSAAGQAPERQHF